MAVKTLLDTPELAALALEWRLGDLRSARGIPEGAVDTLYRIDCHSGRYVLRLLEKGGVEEIRAESALLRRLAAEGYPAVALMQRPDGSLWTMVRERPAVIYRAGAGRHVAPWELSQRQLADAGRQLARLHVLGWGDLPARENRFSPERMRERMTLLTELLHRSRSRTDHQLLAALEEMEREVRLGLSLPEVPTVLLHGDWFPDNLLFTGDGVATVLDFEKACEGPAMLDVATALHAFCFDGNFAWPRAQAFIAGYSSVRGLSRAEREALHPYARFTAARYMVTRLMEFHLTDLPETRLQRKDWRRFHERLRRTLEMGPQLFLQMCGLRA